MKKSKLMSVTAVLFAAVTLIFSGCSNDLDDVLPISDNVTNQEPTTNPGTEKTPESTPAPDPTPTPTPDPDPTPTPDPDPQPNPDPDPDPTPDPQPIEEDITLDLSAYSFRKSFVSTTETLDVTIGDWGDGTGRTKNDDGSLTLTASAAMWGGIPGVVVPFVGLNPGVISLYDYIVFTGDFSDFTIDTSDLGNHGVNVKVPDIQLIVPAKNINADGTYTYYIATSAFENEPKTANEFAIIIGGTGTVKLTEVYLAASENPVKPVTAITIAPETTNVTGGAEVAFTVKDSNLEDVTSSAVFTIEGEDVTGSSISGNVLTAGSAGGKVVVKASYTNDDGTFTATSEVSVLASFTNLVTKVEFAKAYLAPGWSPLLNNVTDADAASDYVTINNNNVTYKLAAGLGGQWQAQLFLNTDADISADDEWYFSCKLSGMSGTYTFKMNDDEVLTKQIVAPFADGDEITCSGKSPQDIENLKLVFDFGTCPEGEVVISDILFAKISK